MLPGAGMFAVFKIVALAYGVTSAIRARFLPALALLVSVLATVALPVAFLTNPTGALGQTVLAAPWLPLLVSAAAGAAATVVAFKRLDREPAGSAGEETMSTLAYALLGNTLLDALMLVVVLFATVAISRNV